MGMMRRVMNVFRGERLNRELDDEMASHLEEAAERGRDAAEADAPSANPCGGVSRAATSS